MSGIFRLTMVIWYVIQKCQMNKWEIIKNEDIRDISVEEDLVVYSVLDIRKIQSIKLPKRILSVKVL